MAIINSIIKNDCKEIINDCKPSLEALSGSNIMITGSNGFLCSYFLDVITAWNDLQIHAPCKMFAIDNFMTGLPERISHLSNRNDVEFIEHDISTQLQINETIDWIIHGASIASPIFYRKYPLETLDVNINGTRNMLELAKQNNSQGIIIMSTSEIYGDPDPKYIPTSEDYRGNVSCTGPRACYDESKRVAETLSYIYYDKFKSPVRVIRPFNVFGPGQRIDDKRIIPDLMSSILSRREITLFSDGKGTRSFCYVSDAICAILKILTTPSTNGQAFNVGNDEIETTINDLAKQMIQIGLEIMGEPENTIIYATNKDKEYITDNPKRRCPDLTKTKHAINWSPKIMLKTALKRTLQSYIE